MVDSTSIRHRVALMAMRASGRARRDDGFSSNGSAGPESDSDGGNRKRRPGLGSILGHKPGQDADKGKKHSGLLGGLLHPPFHLPSDAGKGPGFPFPTSKGSPLFPLFGHPGSPPPAAGGAAGSDPAPSGAVGPPPEKQQTEDPSPVPSPQVAISEDGPSSSASTQRVSNSASRTTRPSSEATVTPDAIAPAVSVDSLTLSGQSSAYVPLSLLPATASVPSETSTTSIAPTASAETHGRKGFPLAAAGAIGATLSFLVVSGIVWGLWFWMRRRRRKRARALPPEWDFSSSTADYLSARGTSDAASVTGTTLSISVPRFSATDEKDVPQPTSPIPNPFAHMEDEFERDPFAGADLRRGNTKGTVSTMSV